MKQNKKTLKIKNKKLMLELGDDYGELNTIVGVATDVAKFATDSLKFWGNMSKFLLKSSWYTFRAKILNNMSQEDYEKALKDTRIYFVNDSDRNISSIDSNISQMLSNAGISEAEINSYMLGLPGYNIIENINASDILTGRAFDKLEDNVVRASNHRAIDLIIFYMYYDLEESLRKEKNPATDEFIEKIKINRASEFKVLEKKIINFLEKRIGDNVFDVLNYLKKTKSGKIMKILDSCNINGTHRYDKINKENKANEFLNHTKNVFASIKKTSNTNENVKSSLSISGKSIELIKEYNEEYNQKTWDRDFKNLLRSFSRSLVLLNKEIRDLALEFHKKKFQSMLEKAEKERESKITEKGGKEDIKLDRLKGLEKFVCTAGFEVNHYFAEINFLNSIIENPVNNSKEITERMQKSYKDVMNKAEVFNSIKSEVISFVNQSANNKYVNELDKKLSDLQKEKVKLIKDSSTSKNKELKEKYIELFNFKKKILILAYADGYFKYLSSVFEKQTLDDFQEYAKNVLDEKTNSDFLPDTIKKILEKLKDFNSADIKKRFSDLEDLMQSQKSSAEQSIKDAEPEIEALKQQTGNTNNKK